MRPVKTQYACNRSLISFLACMKKLASNIHPEKVLIRLCECYPIYTQRRFLLDCECYPIYNQRRFLLDCVNAQADLSLLLVHMSEGMFSVVAAHLFLNLASIYFMTRKLQNLMPNYVDRT